MTSLFKPEELLQRNKKKPASNKAFAIYMDPHEIVVSLGDAKDRLKEVFGEDLLRDPRLIISSGGWSMHDLLFFLLEKTGPAKVYFTTWQISDRAIRMMSEGIKTGLITELYSVLDRRIRIRRSEALTFAQNVCNKVCLIDCHAKITLIENNSWKLSVFSSANMTKNIRAEFYIIYSDTKTFDFTKEWLVKEIETGKPFIS